MYHDSTISTSSTNKQSLNTHLLPYNTLLSRAEEKKQYRETRKGAVYFTTVTYKVPGKASKRKRSASTSAGGGGGGGKKKKAKKAARKSPPEQLKAASIEEDSKPAAKKK